MSFSIIWVIFWAIFKVCRIPTQADADGKLPASVTEPLRREWEAAVSSGQMLMDKDGRIYRADPSKVKVGLKPGVEYMDYMFM